MRRGLRLSERDAAAVQDFVVRVRATPGEIVLELRLFGSKAAGRDTPASDIEVLVIVNEAAVALEDEVLPIAFGVNLTHDVYISPFAGTRAPAPETGLRRLRHVAPRRSAPGSDEIRAFLSQCAHMLDQLSPRDSEEPDV